MKDFEAASNIQDILAILIKRYNDCEVLIARGIPDNTWDMKILFIHPRGGGLPFLSAPAKAWPFSVRYSPQQSRGGCL